MKRLKKCPFCGGVAKLYEDYMGHAYVVQCGRCGISTLHEVTPEKAAKKWNKRVKEEESNMNMEVIENMKVIEQSNTLAVKAKKVIDGHNLADIEMPVYMHEGDACFDFYAPEKYVLEANSLHNIVRTGLAMEIPQGYHMKVFMRSSYGAKRSLRLSNCVGIIDSSYRGEIVGIFDNIGEQPEIIEKGDRFLQGLIEKNVPVQLKEVTELSVTGRGDKGLGSSGR